MPLPPPRLREPDAAPQGVWAVGPGWPSGVLVAMAREGLLVEAVDGTYLAAGLSGTREGRAAALASYVAGAGPVALRAAAWLHGAPDRLTEVDVLRPRGSGPVLRTPGRTRVVPRRLSWRAGDVEHVAGLPVTTPLRTALDLARTGSRDPEREALRWLLTTCVDPAALRRRLEAETGAPGVRRARALLREEVGTSAPGGAPTS